jgi:hypothetical protein
MMLIMISLDRLDRHRTNAKVRLHVLNSEASRFVVMSQTLTPFTTFAGFASLLKDTFFVQFTTRLPFYYATLQPRSTTSSSSTPLMSLLR